MDPREAAGERPIDAVADNPVVCILAGGLSRRLRPLTDTIPKSMVDIAGKPLLERIMGHFASLGFGRFVLAVSYLRQQIEAYFGDGVAFGWDVRYSVEPEPLGTGGAVLLAHRLWAPAALVVNGDTFVPGDWRALWQAHRKGGHPATMALVHQEDTSRFGQVETDGQRVVKFVEKGGSARPGWINAGVYALEERALDGRTAGAAFSLERDVFEPLAGQIGAYLCDAPFADIGTPQSLAEFRRRME
ncbi:MAG: nucleotidyltransferase family protein [Planctomycetaceae bacterium]|nr:nucleotidyltransferase family protein [Planctomycetaceae bacterium]